MQNIFSRQKICGADTAVNFMKGGLHYQTIGFFAEGFREGRFTPLEITRNLLNRIEEIDPRLQAYATLMSDSAVRSADFLTKELNSGTYRGPLHGIPIAVKDLCYTKGVKTMGGTKVLENFTPDYDSTVVARLREAGAVILGKLNLTEGAMGGYNPHRKVPRNPWDKTKWAGSSSSGSGVATASGLCVGSLGSDTGGSIRFPSAACGIVGLKPTYGRVSRHGVLNLAETLDHVGPMARSVVDTALIFKTIAGFDPLDPTTLPDASFDIEAVEDTDINGVELGFDENFAFSRVDPELKKLIEGSLTILESLGAKIVDVSMPDVDSFLPAWKTICTAEAYFAHREYYPNREQEYGPWFRGWLEHGSNIEASQYIEASKLRNECNGLVRAALRSVEAFVCPSTIAFPHSIDDSINYGPMDNLRGTYFQRFTVPFDYNGYPTLSLPCGFNSEGMPASLQLVGKPMGEELICQIGNAYESATEWSSYHPID